MESIFFPKDRESNTLFSHSLIICKKTGCRRDILKIGAIDFEKELELLAHIRRHFTPAQIELRVDAFQQVLDAETLAADMLHLALVLFVDGPPIFPRDFTCPAVLWILLVNFRFHLQDSHLL